MRKGQLTLVEVELVEDLDLMATRISGAGWRADNLLLHMQQKVVVRIGSNDLFDDSAFDEREPLVPAQMRIGQSTLVEAELVEDGRVEVAEVNRILDGAQANGVGGAHDLAPFDSAARHPHGEAEIVVVAALA